MRHQARRLGLLVSALLLPLAGCSFTFVSGTPGVAASSPYAYHYGNANAPKPNRPGGDDARPSKPAPSRPTPGTKPGKKPADHGKVSPTATKPTRPGTPGSVSQSRIIGPTSKGKGKAGGDQGKAKARDVNRGRAALARTR